MAEISKLKLPNGDIYDFKVLVEHVSGQLPITKGGTGAGTASAARTNLQLGTAATHDATNLVEDTTDLPTGAAVETRVSNHIVFSQTQPTGQVAGDIWCITSENPVSYQDGDNSSYGYETT